MGLFTRRARPVDANTTTSTGVVDPTTATSPTTTNGHHHGVNGEKTARRGGFMGMLNGRHHGRYPDTLNSRPTFGQWLKGTWIDIITMVILGAIGLGVYKAPPAPSRSFPITFSDGEIVYPQFAYPLRHEIIPIWASALMSIFIPIAVYLICALRVRSFWDLNNAIMGTLYSLIAAAVFQVFLKWLIGGLRPHFLAVCQPNIPAASRPSGSGFHSIMYRPDICTGNRNQINDSLESFPSGHTTAAFGGFVFLYLYLNAKLKVFSNYHPSLWKLVAIYAPLLGATLIGGALTIDEFHNWYDILAGAIIGTVFAFSSYRMMYASVWDFRFNHVPLARDIPFTYGAGGGQTAFHGFHDAVFTRQAGWGTQEAFGMGGAPFDASGSGGMGGGMGGGIGGHHTNGAGFGHHHDHSDGGVMGGRGTHAHRNSIGRKPVGASADVPAAEHMV